MSRERVRYPGRPSYCPGALLPGRRVRHDADVPTADIVRRYPDGEVTMVSGAGLCSSCGALEQLDREQRRRPAEDAPRGGRRGRS